MRVRFRFSEIYSMKDDIRTKLLAGAHFDQRSELRHYYCCGNSEQAALISERLSVIACGSGDHSALLLVGR